MSEKNKAILKKGNAAIAEGNYEGFLSLCTNDTEWTFVGDRTLKGKQAVREWMAANYLEPPVVTVTNMIAEADFVTAVGTVIMKDKSGENMEYCYCDVWRFHDGELIELKAYVIKKQDNIRCPQNSIGKFVGILILIVINF